MKAEFNAMNEIQDETNSSMMIKVISAFHVLNTKAVACMFLQEKIESAKQLHHLAYQLTHATENQSNQVNLDALKIFTNCYNDVADFTDKLHSIGYTHGDISTENILYGTKISFQKNISFKNSTFEKIYDYQLSDTKPNRPKCYIIDFAASTSKRILTDYDFIEQRIKQATIFQTFLFAHPFLYKFISYPQGRLTLNDNILHAKSNMNINMTKDATDNVIWRFAVSCENYAVATSFLFAFEQTGIFHHVFDRYNKTN